MIDIFPILIVSIQESDTSKGIVLEVW